MKCPYCNSPSTKVTDSRDADDGTSIRRRRQCLECGRRFTTYETVEQSPLRVIKRAESEKVLIAIRYGAVLSGLAKNEIYLRNRLRIWSIG